MNVEAQVGLERYARPKGAKPCEFNMPVASQGETMKAIKAVTQKGKECYIEISEPLTPAGGGAAGGKIAAAGKSAETIMKLAEVGDVIADVCQTLQDRIQAAFGATKPSELTLEFGVKLAGETGIPLVTKGSVEGTFQVTATWDFSKAKG
jgi:hypothetical protein